LTVVFHNSLFFMGAILHFCDGCPHNRFLFENKTTANEAGVI